MSTDTVRDGVIDEIRADLTGIEEKVMTTSLSDLIRYGSGHTQQATNWGAADQACTLSAGALGAVALGVISDEA